MKKVLVLGATGFVGGNLMRFLLHAADVEVTGLARRVPPDSTRIVAVDCTDEAALRQHLADIDCVINCVAGGPDVLLGSARAVAAIARDFASIRIVHMSSMAVYGNSTGLIDETTKIASDGGWYSNVKVESERVLENARSNRNDLIIFRPGCIYGPESAQWTTRVHRLIKSGRLGDLGEFGDGWSNLIYIDDICSAVLSVIRSSGPVSGAFNLAAQPQVRWNRYFTLLACATGSIPLKRIPPRMLKLDAKVLSPMLKIVEVLCKRLRFNFFHLPEIQPPSLVRLWSSEVMLDSSKAERVLGVIWTSVDEGVASCAKWLALKNS